jgi:hypothetical protein
MLLVHLLEAALLAVATTASPLPDQELIPDGQRPSTKACVYGTPKQYDQWTIHYHEVKPPPQFPSRSLLDQAWVARHQNVGDADVCPPLLVISKTVGPLTDPALLLGQYLDPLGGEQVPIHVQREKEVCLLGGVSE